MLPLVLEVPIDNLEGRSSLIRMCLLRLLGPLLSALRVVFLPSQCLVFPEVVYLPGPGCQCLVFPVVTYIPGPG